MDEILIEQVHQYEELYDTASKKYSDALYKERIWIQVGKVLGRSGNECKLRWTCLRDQYRRYLRRIGMKGGQKAKIKNKYKYADEMSFLKPFITARKAIANIDDEIDIASRNMGATQENDMMTASKKLRMSTYSNQLSAGDDDLKPDSICELKIPVHNPLRKLITQSETSSSVLTNCLAEGEKKAVNHINLFFQSIAAAVNEFAPYYQILCKNKVLSVVSDLQLAQLSENNSQASSAKLSVTDAV